MRHRDAGGWEIGGRWQGSSVKVMSAARGGGAAQDVVWTGIQGASFAHSCQFRLIFGEKCFGDAALCPQARKAERSIQAVPNCLGWRARRLPEDLHGELELARVVG